MSLVLERARFPRDKVCGGCLSGLGVHVLRDLIGATGPIFPAHLRSVFVSTWARTVSKHERSTGASRIVLRRDLDERLAQHAAEDHGAEMRFGVAGTARHRRKITRMRVLDARQRNAPREHVLIGAGIGRVLSRTSASHVPARSARRLVSQQWIQPHGAEGLPTACRRSRHALVARRIRRAGHAQPGRRCVVATACELGDEDDACNVFEQARCNLQS